MNCFPILVLSFIVICIYLFFVVAAAAVVVVFFFFVVVSCRQFVAVASLSRFGLLFIVFMAFCILALLNVITGGTGF